MEEDCRTASELFAALKGEDAVVFAHVGGRYADIRSHHDPDLETSVEVHSTWGTFEWLLRDALEAGYRVGVVCNSDGHKGRPGAEYPGASEFGTYGGLTCFLAEELTRGAIFGALRRRRHYGTTGARIHLDVRCGEHRMGDVIPLDADSTVDFQVRVVGSAPIERVEVFSGGKRIGVHRPFQITGHERRLRVLWEGARYRGRGRKTVWGGSLGFTGTAIERFQPINNWNPERSFRREGSGLTWSSVTTGGFSGVDVWLDDASRGVMELSTPLVAARIRLADIGGEERILDAGGLGRRVRLFRLPEEMAAREMTIAVTVAPEVAGDTPVWVKVTQEDGHIAWSSPVYLSRTD